MSIIDYSLMYVTDDRITDDNAFFEILEATLKGGTTIVQLREKQLHTRAFYHRAVESKRLCDLYGIPLIVNDRIDIALAVDAHGVHIGQKDLPVAMARELLQANKIIGLSVSNVQQAHEANALAVDYIGLSPIFGTFTKTADLDPPLGIEGLKVIREVSSKPIVSIGGVDKGNAAEVMTNGSDGIAVVSAISKADNPENATRELRKVLSI
ncbi:thiamine phosphate synthase [Algivirga pacifica]|uniref:Thiamine-phosphate synthase n=1 Tax=Algivirga pacifica TaxID=1162670 RepID=A0ABP9DPP1_9BACT